MKTLVLHPDGSVRADEPRFDPSRLVLNRQWVKESVERGFGRLHVGGLTIDLVDLLRKDENDGA